MWFGETRVVAILAPDRGRATATNGVGLATLGAAWRMEEVSLGIRGGGPLREGRGVMSVAGEGEVMATTCAEEGRWRRELMERDEDNDD